jgi:hypothetical protein
VRVNMAIPFASYGTSGYLSLHGVGATRLVPIREISKDHQADAQGPRFSVPSVFLCPCRHSRQQEPRETRGSGTTPQPRSNVEQQPNNVGFLW